MSICRATLFSHPGWEEQVMASGLALATHAELVSGAQEKDKFIIVHFSRYDFCMGEFYMGEFHTGGDTYSEFWADRNLYITAWDHKIEVITSFKGIEGKAREHLRRGTEKVSARKKKLAQNQYIASINRFATPLAKRHGDYAFASTPANDNFWIPLPVAV